MHKIVFILLLSLFSVLALGQTADTISYGSIKLTCHNKFDKRPEPSFDLNRFIMKKLRYPGEALESNIQGIVYIQFTIDETGKVTNPAIVNSPHNSLSDEAIRLVGLMSAWSPATLNGSPTPVSLIMPLIFKLE
jgi:TonB family protein